MKNVGAPAGTAVRATLHIEELVIRGLPSLNRDSIAEAVQTRLALLLAGMDGAITPSAAGLMAPIVRLRANATAEQIGDQIAQAVCDALLKGGSPR